MAKFNQYEVNAHCIDYQYDSEPPACGRSNSPHNSRSAFNVL